MISNDIQKRLGENLKRIRKSKNLTQFQLAEIADVSEETIKNIELCRCWTSDKNLAKITKDLQVDIHCLFLPVCTSFDKDSEDSTVIKKAIAEVLLEEGYIKALEEIESDVQGVLRVTLKYDEKGNRVIDGLRRISKPGLRIYASKDELPKVLNGLGIALISTSKGIMTDKKARELGIGGEVLAYIW